MEIFLKLNTLALLLLVFCIVVILVKPDLTTLAENFNSIRLKLEAWKIRVEWLFVGNRKRKR